MKAARTSVAIGRTGVSIVVVVIIIVAALAGYVFLSGPSTNPSSSPASTSSPAVTSQTTISSSSPASSIASSSSPPSTSLSSSKTTTSASATSVSSASTSSCYVTTSSSAQPVTVNVALEPGIITEPLYIANATGLFAKYGIKANFVTYSSDSAIMTAMGAGQIDYAIEIPDVIANSIAAGVNVKVIGAVLGNLTNGNAVLVRTNSSLTSVSQLNGKKVAVSALGSLTDIWAKMIMRQDNINFTEVALGQTARAAALLSGQVDAAIASGPQVYTLTTQGQARVLLNITESVVPYFSPYAVAIASNSLIQNQPNVVRQLLEATFQSIQYMRDNAQQSYPILAAEIGSTPSVGPWLYNITIPYFSSNGILNATQMLQSVQLQNQLTGSPNAVPSESTMYSSQFLPVSLKTC